MSAPNPAPAINEASAESDGFKPFVPEKTDMREFTVRAVVLGLIMTVVLGAANAYLGLKAGMTIAATYPAAIIGMAVLRLFKGSVLEENMARTVGSIGESVAAGAVFTIPAFVISGAWSNFQSPMAYAKSTALMIVGGLLGIFFVTLLRRVMVEDKTLPFPESVAASEIHKAGQRGMGAAKALVQAMGVGSVVFLGGVMNFFSASRWVSVPMGAIGRTLRLGVGDSAPALKTGATSAIQLPSISPAYLGVGYIIGPELGALNFAGGLLAWGFFVPLLMFFLHDNLVSAFMAADPNLTLDAARTLVASRSKDGGAQLLWKFIVRPMAVGGMLVGACFTLFKMRKNLALGMKRAVGDLKKSATAQAETGRCDRDLPMKVVFAGLAVVALLMVAVYYWFTGAVGSAILATVVMAIAGFFFAAVSGNLVGLIGSSNNPISGLTLSTLILAALLMVMIGASGIAGVAAVLGVAAVVCVAAAVAGEMLQDLKVGHLLGGTPAKMQTGDILGIFFAGAVMYFPLLILHRGNIAAGGIGFGDPQLSAPQAGLMAALSQGIVGGEMAWPLVIVGVLMGLAMVLVKVRSPMLLFVGMYLPLETTAAIFVGGVIRWIADGIGRRRGFNAAQKARTENTGVLVASGLIAGEALMGLVIAGFQAVREKDFWSFPWAGMKWMALPVLVALAAYMVVKPIRSAGSPDEPPPPTAVM